jgi:ribosomal protein L37AE/L43A
MPDDRSTTDESENLPSCPVCGSSTVERTKGGLEEGV